MTGSGGKCEVRGSAAEKVERRRMCRKIGMGEKRGGQRRRYGERKRKEREAIYREDSRT